MPPINIIKALRTVLDNLFGSSNELKIFCQTYETELGLSYENNIPTNETFGNQKSAFLLALKKERKLGRLIKLLSKKKGTPDILELEKIWKQSFKQNDAKIDLFNTNAFDLIFFRDNNENLPFIGRDDFKKEIRSSINSSGNLRLIINGAERIGVSYLRQYLTQLDKKFDCLKNFIIIDCKIDLGKEPEDQIHPVHIAEYLLFKFDMDIPAFVDLENPSKFKERYYSRIADSIKSNCEEQDRAIVLFIDHLHQKMDENVFRFLASFINKLKQFKTPFILILGGIHIDKNSAISTEDIKEITLEPFEQGDVKIFLEKLYNQLKANHTTFFEDFTVDEFINSAIQGIDKTPGNTGGPDKIKILQNKIKVWHNSLQEEIKTPA